MKKLSFSRQIIISFSLVVLVISLMMIFINFGVSDLSKTAYGIEYSRLPTVQASQNLKNGIFQSLAALRGWMLLGHEQFKRDRVLAWEKGINFPLENLQRLSMNWTKIENIERLAKIKVNIDKFRKYQEEIEDKAQTKDSKFAITLLRSKAVPTSKEILEQLIVMVENQNTLLADDFLRHRDNIKLLNRISWSLFGISLFIIISIGIMIVRAITVPINNAVKLAQEIGQGDMQSSINLSGSSEIKELGHSMTQMRKQLIERSETLESQNWLKTQVEKFAKLTQGATDLRLMSNSIISTLSKLTKAGYGVLYLKNDGFETESKLSLLGSYACEEHKNISGEISIGEGLVGQCAKEKQAIYLTNVPGDYIQINSALGEKTPLNILVAPILFEQQLQGVIELASFKEFSDNEREMIEVVTENIGIVINGVLRQKDRERETKDAKAKINGVVDTAEDAIVTIDEKGLIQSINSSGTKMFGYSKEEVLGKNIKRLMPQPHSGKHDGYLSRYTRTGEKRFIGKGREAEAIRKDGSTFPVYVSVGEIILENGSKIFSGVIRDISEQKQTENKIQLQNKALEQQNKLKTNLAALYEKMRGDQDIPHLGNNILSYLAKCIDFQIGTLYLANNGQLNLVSSFAYQRQKNSSNEFKFGEGLVGQCALEGKTIFLNNVPKDYIKVTSGLGKAHPSNILIAPIFFDNDVVAVLELGSLREFTDGDINFLELSAESIGISINTNQSRSQLQELLEETQRQSEEMQTQQQELQASNESLEEQTQQLQASEEESKSQSEELRASNEELSEKSKALEIQKQNVERSREDLEIKTKDLTLASKYKSEFLANMSHELRTPLNSFLLLSKGLSDNRKGNLDADQLKDLKIIYEGGSDLLHLINDIMDLSKVEAGKLAVQFEDVDLSATCRNLTNLFNPSAKNKVLAFTIEREEQTPTILNTDFQRLEQILRNFLSNAFKFTESGSVQLKIHLSVPDTRFMTSSLNTQNTLAFSVIDTGIGIPTDKQKPIFEAFQQEDGSTGRKYGGTGLGLTICRELAKILGGEIQLSSTQGVGSTFTLYLPLRLLQEHAADEEIGTLSPHPQPISETPTDSVTVGHNSIEPFVLDDRNQLGKDDNVILIIEDDANFAEVLLKIVRNQGYKGLVAGDGKNGLYMALEYQPKGIFLDLGLPDMDGSVVLEQLKFHLNTKHIPVHVISGTERDLVTLQSGAMGFLSKPVSEEDINRVIEEMQRIHSAEFKTALIVEDNKDNQRAISGLISHKGLQIECVDTGSAAVEKISNHQFDCVILDIGLPDMSGFEVLEKLNKDRCISMPPIIIYTGQELSRQERNQLQKYAATIVLKDAESPEKLLDEALLFMHSMTEELSSSQKKTINNIHDETKLLHNRKILLVDDDMRNTFALSKRLQETGLIVYEADNGQSALNKLNEQDNVDLIIMDIMMPIMDGYEAMQHIRQSKQYKKVPIIALTAKAMPKDRVKCIEAGATDYLTKPVEFDRLLSMLKVWLFKK